MNEKIVEYIRANLGTFTREALRDQLLNAGYEPDEVDAALDAEAAPAIGAEPLPGAAERHPRLVAAGILVAAYAGSWLLFALVTDWQAAHVAAASTVILAGVLAVFGLISLIYVAATKRLTTGGRAAILGVLTVPIVLLLIIGGLCVPFTPFRWR